ncbi:hypothetical protein Tco_0379584 [Tanacetum coccineum]
MSKGVRTVVATVVRAQQKNSMDVKKEWASIRFNLSSRLCHLMRVKVRVLWRLAQMNVGEVKSELTKYMGYSQSAVCTVSSIDIKFYLKSKASFIAEVVNAMDCELDLKQFSTPSHLMSSMVDSFAHEMLHELDLDVEFFIHA